MHMASPIVQEETAQNKHAAAEPTDRKPLLALTALAFGLGIAVYFGLPLILGY